MFDYIQNNFQDVYYTSIIGAILLFLVAEHLFPRVHHQEAFYLRWANNIGLSIVTLYTATLFSFFYLNYASVFATWTPNIILNEINTNYLIAFIQLFFFMEFISYWMHRAFHEFKLLWRVHAVHHSDVEIDATTTHRHHPLEVIFSTILLTPVYFLLQSPVEVYITYTFLRIAIVTLSHSNLKLPDSVDRALRWVIVTPDFHRLHHSDQRKYTDSNYGSITPWFDYLFGTATRIQYEEQTNFRTGLEYKRDIRDSRVDRLLLLPFIWLNNKKSS